MILDWQQMDIFVKSGSTDFRKQINGLAQIVQDELELNLFRKALFLFCSRDRRKIKILYWDRNGFCLWQKRLEHDRFPWPTREDEVRKLTYAQFEMLLSGIDFFQAHRELSYLEI